MQNFRQLKVWQKAHRLTLALYQATARFPPSELYGLTAQLRRAGASIGANAAEGCMRSSDAEFCRFFLWMAAGSASEVEYHLLLAHDLGILSATDFESLSERTVEIKRMLAALIRRLTADS